MRATPCRHAASSCVDYDRSPRPATCRDVDPRCRATPVNSERMPVLPVAKLEHLPIRLILLHFAILGTRNRQVITRIRPRTQHPITAFCRSCPSPLYRRQCAELAITRPITSLLRPRKAMGVTSEVPRRSIMRDHPRAAPSLERGGRGAGHWRRAVVLATGLARAAHLPRLAAGIRHRLLLYASDQIKSCRS